MKTSEQIAKLAEALTKAQAGITTVKKDKSANVGKYGYTYASLAQVMSAISEPLAKQSLAVVQGITQESGKVIVTTRLIHSSGQWIESDCAMPVSQATAQGVGSAITYGRRYGVSALLGIVSDDDDDGAAAEKEPPKPDGRTKSQRVNEKINKNKEADNEIPF